jgi:RimJ/RimL family protein N-acetyltransferase
MIQTVSLDLITCDLPHFEAMFRGDKHLESLLNVGVAQGWCPFPEAMDTAYAVLRAKPELIEWWTYLFIHRHHRILIGSGGFHGMPDHIGMVEIGYGIAPQYRNRGFATEAAQGLIDLAFSNERVQMVDARTVPEENPSTNVLTKLGMQKLGRTIDSDVGTVWHWRINRNEYVRA